MATPIELSDELFENVSNIQKLANDKYIANVGLSKFEDDWLERMFDVVEPWERRIDALKVGKPFRSTLVEEKFTKSFTEAYKALAVIDLEFHGLKKPTAEKLVASLIK